MNNRRSFNILMAGSPLLASLNAFAAIGTYPEKPIKLIVGFPAGQTTDLNARIIARHVEAALGQPVVVDNRPGANGILSHVAAKSSAPDGYTILAGSSGTLAINPTLFKKLAYAPLVDFEPIGLMTKVPSALFTSVQVPVNNVQEMVAYVKSRPGKVTFASPGNGSSGHIAMEMLKQATGLEMLHVPYKGSPPMISDIIGRQVDFAFEPMASITPFVDQGRVKLLGVGSPQRLRSLPQLPTIAEQGIPGFQTVTWSGILAPKGTPPEIVKTLNAAINAALTDPTISQALIKSGNEPSPGTPAEFAAFIAAQMTLWGKAVAASGAQPD